MKRLTRKQAEKLVQTFDPTAYAQCTHDRRSLMFCMPEHDIAGYGGDYVSALYDAHVGSFDATPEQLGIVAKLHAIAESLMK